MQDGPVANRILVAVPIQVICLGDEEETKSKQEEGCWTMRRNVCVWLIALLWFGLTRSCRKRGAKPPNLRPIIDKRGHPCPFFRDTWRL
jgi:hypothetical protein